MKLSKEKQLIIAIIVGLLTIAIIGESCTPQKGGCHATRNYVGYGR